MLFPDSCKIVMSPLCIKPVRHDSLSRFIHCNKLRTRIITLKQKKKLFILLPSLALLILALLFLRFLPDGQNRRFRQISEEFFAASLAGDSLSLHYVLADPSPYLTPQRPAALPLYSVENRRASAAVLENFLAALQTIEPEKLNRHNRYVYSLLIPWLENELSGARCEYFDEPLSPFSGVHTELPLLLAEYTFRTREDVEDYLNLLESIPAFLESISQYEKEKAAAGLFMTQADAARIVEQCDRILDPDLLESETHFLQTTFRERLEGLTAAGLLTAAEAEKLTAENNRLLRTVAAPAYVALADDIFLLSDSGVLENSVCQASGGSAWYLYLLRRNTGSFRTPEEIHELLSARLQELFTQLQELLAEYESLTGGMPSSLTPVSFPLQEPDAILADLQQRIVNDFPPLTGLTDDMPLCVTKAVDASLEEYTSPAFYLTPPIDDLAGNVIYINNASTPPGLELYTTLAHEGWPGHLYQTVYSQLCENAAGGSPVRSVLYYGGYVEGWAYYVENIAYEYAADLLLQNGGSEADRVLTQIACVERNLQVNLYCLLDLSIHYYGAGRGDVSRSLEAFGITDRETVSSIYDYIRMEPTTYLKYYLGYLEILSLRDQAMDLWKDSYTPLRFHTFLLQAGPSDFERLKLLLTGDTEPAASAAFSGLKSRERQAGRNPETPDTEPG